MVLKPSTSSFLSSHILTHKHHRIKMTSRSHNPVVATIRSQKSLTLYYQASFSTPVLHFSSPHITFLFYSHRNSKFKKKKLNKTKRTQVKFRILPSFTYILKQSPNFIFLPIPFSYFPFCTRKSTQIQPIYVSRCSPNPFSFDC